MTFDEIVKEYARRDNPLTDDELRMRRGDEEWVSSCFKCDQCNRPILHDDESFMVNDLFLCDEHVEFDDDGERVRSIG